MKTQVRPWFAQYLSGFAQHAAIGIAAIGVIVLIGWLLDVALLKSVFPDAVSMKANTAIGFVLAGLSLAILANEHTSRRMRRFAQVCAGVVALLGLLTLSQYVFKCNLGLDELLFVEPSGAAATSSPGRMSPFSALNFILVGLSLLLLDSPVTLWIGRACALTVGAVGLLNLLGYVYSVEPLYGVASYSHVAIHTAIGFVLFAVASLCARPEHGLMGVITSNSAGGVIGRRLLPATVLVPVVLGAARLAGQRAGWYETEFGVALSVHANVLLFSAVALWSVASLHRVDMLRQRTDEALRESESQKTTSFMASQADLEDQRQAALNLAQDEMAARQRAERAEQEVRKLNEELEQRVLQRTIELEAANKELEAFSYSVSHDLRAPLRAIDGFSRILLEEHASQLSEDGHRYLRMSRENSQRMGQLIDDLLAFSRLGRQQLQKRAIEPTSLVRSVLADLRDDNPGREVEVVIGELGTCEADPALLKQVFINLLANAFKFTSAQAAPRIEIGCRNGAPAGPLAYFVKDNGAGFDMQYAPKLFGVFQRLHRAEDYPGTGVGLAIVQRIIHRHGGRVWAEGAVNQGATFNFTLS